MGEQSNLAAALVAALAEVPLVKADHKANAGTFTYDYADLAGVVAASRPVLAKHGVVALTPVAEHGDGLACTVILLHSSGERMNLGPFPFPHGKDAQATGSMVTYHRRYALLSALGMAVGDDDDGAAAKPRQKQAAQAQKPPAPTSEPLADHAVHEALRRMIADLPAKGMAELQAWWATEKLPPIKRADRLTEPQVELAMAKVEELTPDFGQTKPTAEPPTEGGTKDGTEPFPEAAA